MTKTPHTLFNRLLVSSTSLVPVYIISSTFPKLKGTAMDTALEIKSKHTAPKILTGYNNKNDQILSLLIHTTQFPPFRFS